MGLSSLGWIILLLIVYVRDWQAKKAAMERDWQLVKLENFSMELVPLQFQSGIDYTARPPKSDGEYESDHEDEELFELESRMSTP